MRCRVVVGRSEAASSYSFVREKERGEELEIRGVVRLISGRKSRSWKEHDPCTTKHTGCEGRNGLLGENQINVRWY